MKNIIFSVLFVLIAIATRTSLHIASNVEFITAIGLISGYFINNKKYSFIPVALSLFITDLIIGNTIIFLFTWSAFLITPILGQFIRKISKEKKISRKFIFIELSGIASTVVFFLWTNFGVVLTTNMYEKNLYGLVNSYINALPFLTNQLIGNIIIVPISFALFGLLDSLFEENRFDLRNFKSQ